MDNYYTSTALTALEEAKAENAKLRDLLVKQAERLVFPPITETQIRLSHAIGILNTISKRSRYYNHVQDAIGIIKNATPPISRTGNTSDT